MSFRNVFDRVAAAAILVSGLSRAAVAQTPDSWRALGDLPEPRADAGAGVVDGIIYLFGGRDPALIDPGDPSAGISDKTWAFNPATPDAGWKEMARMPDPVAEMGSAVLDGKIYSVCGMTNGGTAIGDTYLFDPGAGPDGTWSTIATSTEHPTLFATACGVIGSKIYLCGGYADGTARTTTWEIDPSDGTWTQKADLPLDPQWLLDPGLPPGVNSAFGGVIGGRLYIAGGFWTSGSNGEPDNPWRATWEFDPEAGADGTWTRRADMPDSVLYGVYLGASAVAQGRLYCLGGWIIEPSDEPWTATLEFEPSSGDHPDGRWFNRAAPIQETYAATAVGYDGKVYLMGDAYINYGSNPSMVQVYTPDASLNDSALPWELRQVGADGRQIDPGGGLLNGEALAFEGIVYGAVGRALRLEVEVVETHAAFTGIPGIVGEFGEAGAVRTGFFLPPSEGAYKWRARTWSDDAHASAWVDFGLPGRNPDFRVGDFVRFVSAAVSVGETQATATFAVRRAGTDGPLSVHYGDAGGGTAIGGGVDYTLAGGVLTWGDGDGGEQTFTVPVTTDSIAEESETVRVLLSDPSGGAFIDGTTTAVLTISDSPGRFEFASDGAITIGETARAATITVRRLGGKGGAVAVGYGDGGGGRAAAGSDYSLVRGTLSWANGDIGDKTFTVTIRTDAIAEDSENVMLLLDTPTGGSLIAGTNPASLTITDSPGTLQFASTGNFSVAEGEGALTIVVRRAGGKGGAVGASWSAQGGGTAAPGVDFQPATGRLTWDDGDTSEKTFTVAIMNDGADEGDETVIGLLSEPLGGAILGGINPATLTIVDDDTGFDGGRGKGGGGGRCAAGPASGSPPLHPSLLIMMILLNRLRRSRLRTQE